MTSFWSPPIGTIEPPAGIVASVTNEYWTFTVLEWTYTLAVSAMFVIFEIVIPTTILSVPLSEFVKTEAA